MTGRITDGICRALRGGFPDAEVYTELTEQALHAPGFAVICDRTERKQFLGNRYLHKAFYRIVYFPSSSDHRREFADTSDRLFKTLSMIGIENGNETAMILGNSMSAAENAEDDVLIFSVEYGTFCFFKEETAPMGVLSAETDIK